MNHRRMAALTLLQKHIHQRDLTELIDRLATILLAGYLSSPQVISLIRYIIQAGESSDAGAFVRQLAQRVPRHGDELMTIAKQLEQRGIEKGRQEAALKIARTMLQNGLDFRTVREMTGLSREALRRLRH